MIAQGMTEDWHCDFAGNRELARQAIAASTPEQRLAWLDEVLLLAYRAGAVPLPRDPWTGLRLPLRNQGEQDRH